MNLPVWMVQCTTTCITTSLSFRRKIWLVVDTERVMAAKSIETFRKILGHFFSPIFSPPERAIVAAVTASAPPCPDTARTNSLLLHTKKKKKLPLRIIGKKKTPESGKMSVWIPYHAQRDTGRQVVQIRLMMTIWPTFRHYEFSP